MTPWTRAALTLSGELAEALGQEFYDPPQYPVLEDEPDEYGMDFWMLSRTRPGLTYAMRWTPDGYAVHYGEGCEYEIYSGPLGCWHSKKGAKKDMTQAVTNYQAQVPQRTEFSEEEIKVIKNTICRGSTDAELGLFMATCRATALNPFMKQIWAIQRNVKVGDRQNPKWEKQMTIQVGIDGYRVIRDRLVDQSGYALFEGMDGPQWSEDGRDWLDFPSSSKPAFARVAIYRRGIPRPFVAVARWDAYVQDGPMWDRMGAEQLAKCAESLGLRRAFPAEMSGLPSGPIAELDPPLDDLPPQVAGLIEGDYTEAPDGNGGAQVQEGGDRPAAPPPAPITPETKKAVESAYHVVRETRGEEFPLVRRILGERWPHAFLSTVNRLGELTEAEAFDVLQLLEKETPKDDTAEGEQAALKV